MSRATATEIQALCHRHLVSQRAQHGHIALVKAANGLAEAGRLLGNSTWTIEYPAGMDEKEADKLLRPSGSGANVSLAANEDLQAGFRLRHDNACLDMSVRGLLAQVDEMAGELLAEIHRQQEELGAQT